MSDLRQWLPVSGPKELYELGSIYHMWDVVALIRGIVITLETV